MNRYLVIDVESIGLHGEGFAVAGVLLAADGRTEWEFCYSCPPETATGPDNSRTWVAENVTGLTHAYTNPRQLRDEFWRVWCGLKEQGVLLTAECCWPVEARFLAQCVDDDMERREWGGPYPLHDVASFMEATGTDPMAPKKRTGKETPAHNPLCDARQSARLLLEALKILEPLR